MSDRNSQNPNKLIASIPEPSIGTKNSLEQINNILKEIHKNILRENNSQNATKSINNDEKEKNEEINNNLGEDKKKENIEKIEEEKNQDNNEEKEIDDTEINDNSDKISNININQMTKNDYKTSMDINIIKSIGIKNK